MQLDAHWQKIFDAKVQEMTESDFFKNLSPEDQKDLLDSVVDPETGPDELFLLDLPPTYSRMWKTHYSMTAPEDNGAGVPTGCGGL